MHFLHFASASIINIHISVIKGHDLAEEVAVTLVSVTSQNLMSPEMMTSESPVYVPVPLGRMVYEYDSTFYLTKFLTSR